MKTVSVHVMDLSVPCANRCRYCLLSYDGRVNGVGFDRSMAYAQGFHDWLRQNRPELNFLYGWGYSMEHPRLQEAIRFCRSLGSATGEFLQFDGMAMRTQAELRELLTMLRREGIRLIDLTFYGTEDYHDRFAARKGDYRLMMDTLAVANEVGLDVTVSIALTRENTDQLEELLQELGRHQTVRTVCFVPHAEGRGRLLDPVRLTLDDWERLNPDSRGLLNRTRFRTEGEWVREPELPPQERRVLTFVLTPEEQPRLEKLGYAGAMEWLEKLDDAYHRAVPDFCTLRELYGDPNGRELYSFRDLHQHYQRRYIAEHGLTLYDIHEENSSFVRRL